MNEIVDTAVFQLARVTLVSSILVVMAALLIRFTRLRPSTWVAAWMIVLLPGWFLCSVAVELPWYEPRNSEVAGYAQVSPGVPFEFQMPEPPALEIASVSAMSQFRFAIFVIWILGGLTLIAKYFRSFMLLRNAVESCPGLDEISHPDSLKWRAELDQVRDELGITKPVQMRISQQFGPLICRTSGRYSLVVPESVWSAIDENQRIIVLQHELSHLVRGDVWKVLVARLLMLPQWFNPLTWFALRRFDAAIEMACDDYVLECTSASQVEYAKSLVSLIEFNHQPSEVALAIGGPPVRKRIQRIVQPKGLEMKFARLLTIVSLFSISLLGFLKLELVAQEVKASTSPYAQSRTEPKAVSQQPLVIAAQKPNTNVNAQNEKIVMMSYSVSDLVTPKPLPKGHPHPVYGLAGSDPIDGTKPMVLLGGVTEKDFFPITDLIKSEVDPDSWKPGESGEIEIYVPNMQLIIASTKENHEQIESLLNKLRELSAITIELDSFVAIVSDDHELAKGLAYDKPLPIEQKDAQRFIKQYRTKLFRLPKTTCYNGQMMTKRGLSFGGAEIECLTVHPLYTVNLKKGEKTLEVTLFCMSEEPTILRDPKDLEKSGKYDETVTGEDESKLLVEKTGTKKQSPLLPKLDPKKMTGLVNVASKGCARFDITGFLKNPKKGSRAVLIVRSTVVDKRAEIAKLPKSKVLEK